MSLFQLYVYKARRGSLNEMRRIFVSVFYKSYIVAV
jgi:hypothetical protein